MTGDDRVSAPQASLAADGYRMDSCNFPFLLTPERQCAFTSLTSAGVRGRRSAGAPRRGWGRLGPAVLASCKITHVAMESAGSYSSPVFHALAGSGDFEVIKRNAAVRGLRAWCAGTALAAVPAERVAGVPGRTARHPA